ncbi:universal stress protein [Natronolimnohabitans sp. A-GB9]|uniref:universal stress protein n=1 Tax=Natronolimnohabitans sp. A-GB9 TaxID=3069757 RepID=UPI0027B1FB0C|nr:universal stress protein [Natronolimnohabitans sp. A-GB9]MDQ2050320.1 universal stress protein [Natronolimnohabitans sp. A-GB9]
MVDSDPDRVLVPSLGRPREDEALAYALETFPDAEIVLLAVVTPLDDPLSEGGVLERDDERTAAARQASRDLLESVADDVPSATERVRLETVEGRPGTVVPRYASEEDIDHVVIHGHDAGSIGFVRRFLGRNVATTVTERTDEPVTVLE